MKPFRRTLVSKLNKNLYRDKWRKRGEVWGRVPSEGRGGRGRRGGSREEWGGPGQCLADWRMHSDSWSPYCTVEHLVIFSGPPPQKSF